MTTPHPLRGLQTVQGKGSPMAGLWGFSFSIRWGIGEGKLEWETVMLDIVMEDEAVIVVRKPAGVESQGGRGFSMDLESEILQLSL